VATCGAQHAQVQIYLYSDQPPLLEARELTLRPGLELLGCDCCATGDACRMPAGLTTGAARRTHLNQKLVG
jgi:hypothetical protein